MVKLPFRVPLGAWQLRRDAPCSFYLFQPLSTHVNNRNSFSDPPKKQSSGFVVSPKEVFMNAAAAAIPETRSARIHQWGSDSYPHFRKWYHLTLSFQDFCMISRNIRCFNIQRLAKYSSSLSLRHAPPSNRQGNRNVSWTSGRYIQNKRLLQILFFLFILNNCKHEIDLVTDWQQPRLIHRKCASLWIQLYLSKCMARLICFGALRQK